MRGGGGGGGEGGGQDGTGGGGGGAGGQGGGGGGGRGGQGVDRERERERGREREREDVSFDSTFLPPPVQTSNAHNYRLMKVAVDRFQGSVVKRLFPLWRDNAHRAKVYRESEEKKALMRQNVMVMENEEAAKQAEIERLQAEEEERRRLEEERREKERIEAEKALWESHKVQAQERAVQRKILQIQQVEWRKIKEEKKRKENEKHEDKWDNMVEEAVRGAEEEALDFLATPGGQELMKVNTEAVKKSSAVRRGKKGKKGAIGGGDDDEENPWKQMYDPLLNEWFFFSEDFCSWTLSTECRAILCRVLPYSPLHCTALLCSSQLCSCLLWSSIPTSPPRFLYPSTPRCLDISFLHLIIRISYLLADYKTGERVMADSLSDEEAFAIARSNFVEERISIAKQLAVNIRKEETRKWVEDKAIRKLQDMVRCRIQYKMLRRLIDIMYIKRVDPYTGDTYYYNTQTRVAKWTKPLCLGSKDLHVDQWVTMGEFRANEKNCFEAKRSKEWPSPVDSPILTSQSGGTLDSPSTAKPDGQSLFYKQTIRPYDESETKPPGFRVCLECGFNLAKRRCFDCEYEYCIECWERKHTAWSKHKWEKINVSLNYCVMCKKKVAEKVCVHCRLDCFCSNCSKMMHSKAARRNHKIVDI